MTETCSGVDSIYSVGSIQFLFKHQLYFNFIFIILVSFSLNDQPDPTQKLRAGDHVMQIVTV